MNRKILLYKYRLSTYSLAVELAERHFEKTASASVFSEGGGGWWGKRRREENEELAGGQRRNFVRIKLAVGAGESFAGWPPVT